MPYKIDTDKKLIPLALKRNTKITEEQKVEIREIYATGSSSHRKLAAAYGVEKSTIAFILNPEKYELSKERAKANRHKYYSKEKQAKYTKRTRDYRVALNKDNKLEDNQL